MTTGAIELDLETFDEVVGRDKYVFVDFYASWCPHCKNLAPVWDDLARHFAANTDDDLLIAKIDADKFKAIGTKFRVKFYPTLLFFAPQSLKYKEYQDRSRKLPDLISWATNHIGTGKNLENFVEPVGGDTRNNQQAGQHDVDKADEDDDSSLDQMIGNRGLGDADVGPATTLGFYLGLALFFYLELVWLRDINGWSSRKHYGPARVWYAQLLSIPFLLGGLFLYSTSSLLKMCYLSFLSIFFTFQCVWWWAPFIMAPSSPPASTAVQEDLEASPQRNNPPSASSSRKSDSWYHEYQKHYEQNLTCFTRRPGRIVPDADHTVLGVCLLLSILCTFATLF